MISIIIASVKKELLEDVKQNISKTIGLEYEVLEYENSQGQRGLCEIYNLGANEAKYPILCFMHEDIEIKTGDWGKKILEKFEDKSIGVIGLAGSAYKSVAPSGWGADGHKLCLNYQNYIQYFKRSNKESFHAYINPYNKWTVDVVAADGMWFCTTKEIALATKFDSAMLKGFHCYDLDYCFAVGQKHRVVVVYDVLISHFSEGGYDESWLEDTLKLHKKWEKVLPLSTIEISDDEKLQIEKRTYRTFMALMLKMGLGRNEVNSFLEEQKRRTKMSLLLYAKLKLQLIKWFYLGEKLR